MIITGAGGHALELLEILQENNYPGVIRFFDDTGATRESMLLGQYPIITSVEDAVAVLKDDPDFAIGVGRPSARMLLYEKLTAAGGVVRSVISPYAHIGKNKVQLGEGLNIMTGAVITVSSIIGMGTLVHIHCSIHHNAVIGDFCELSPGCRILGNVHIGSFVSVGTGAVILPGIRVGDHAVVGAGAVVTEDVPPQTRVAGVPAKRII